MKKIFLGILAGWALFLAAFVVAFVLVASCSPLFAQGDDLQNADIEPTEVIEILPEPEEPEEPPFFPPEEFPDFWSDEDENFFPFFAAVSRVNPVLAQLLPIDPVEIEPEDPDDPFNPDDPDDPGSPSLPPDSGGWGELVLQALANLYPSGNYQMLMGRTGRTLTAGIDSKGDLRVVDPENMQNQAAFDPETGDLKQFEQGADPSFISNNSDANIYDSYPDLEDWTAEEIQNSSGGNGENQQQGDEQQPEVPEEFQSFSLWSIISPLAEMAIRGISIFLGLYLGLWVIGIAWKKFKSLGASKETSMSSSDFYSLEEKELDDYIAESKRILGEE